MNIYRILKYIMVLLVPLTLFSLIACSKYTPPSPLDGKWYVIEVKKRNAPPQVYDGSNGDIYLDVLNVLYLFNSHTPQTKQNDSWGLISFKRDTLILQKDADEKVEGWPIFDGIEGRSLRLKYRVWHNKLVLSNSDYTVTLQSNR